MKTIPFKTPAATAEDWVKAGRDDPEAPAAASKPVAGLAEPTKRLIIDLPLGLHTRLKVGCARRMRTIADEVRDLIDREFPTT